MNPEKRERQIIQEYWYCGVNGEGHYHRTERGAAACIARIAKAILLESKAPYPSYILDTPVNSIMAVLSKRSRNTLEYWNGSVNSYSRLQINTVGDLVNTPESELLKMQNFGKKSLQEIKDAINALMLSTPEK